MLDDITDKGARVALLRGVMLSKGVHQYGLDDLSQLQHALQAAWQAERAGLGDAMIAAALLHDIGHMVHDLGENPAADGIDDEHEEVGARFLESWFPPAVSAPVRLHVAAKRYLCGSDPSYFALLSPDSVRSLALQGGPMTAAEQDAFRALPFSAQAVQLRRFDEGAKDPDLVTPDIDFFLPAVERCLA
jgi:phosphonate degradation associated HDIG domain protein